MIRSVFHGDDRAASEVVAVALLVGVVALGVAAILLVGGAELTDAQTDTELRQAERALTQLDAAAARVATATTSTQRVDLGLRGNRGTVDTEPDAGRVTVEYVEFLDDGNATEVANTTMGTVVYENGDSTVGYQGGGVWRSDGNGSVMVSPPEITFRGKTLTLRLIRTTRGGSVHTDVQVVRTGPGERRFPDAGNGLDNEVEGASVKITVRSRYYRAWGRFFEDEADTIVQYDDANREATVLFLALPTDFSPDAGVIATSGPGEIRVEGNGAYVDSYNSSEGSYADTNGDQGVVKAAGDITTKGDARVDGDIIAGHDILVDGSSIVDGDASAKGDITVDGSGQITGTTADAENVPDVPPINRLVEDNVNELSDPANNDNDATSAVDGNELRTGSDDTAELGAGDYYLERIDLQGERLVLNTTEGDITIAVRDWVTLERDGGTPSEIVVEGEGRVRLYVGSEQAADVSVPGGGQAPEGLDTVHFFVERDGEIDVPGDESLRFQVLAPDDFRGAIGGSNSANADVVAAVIAPAGPVGDGQFYVQHGDLYGAVTTGNLTLGQYGQVHFDRALIGEEIPLAPNSPRLEYLYVTEHEIEVKEA